MPRFIIIYTSIIVLAIGAFWIFGQSFVTRHTQASVAFTIEPQESVVSVAQKLAEKDLISSKFVFFLYALFSGDFSRFQPGVYVVTSEPSVRDIISLLVQGPRDVEVVLYPGMTLAEADERLAQKGVITQGSLIDLNPETLEKDFPFLQESKNLEGFLMPDTYRFYPNDSAQNAARIILKNFAAKEKDFITQSPEVIRRTLIIASMIEKEAASDEEKPLIAGVIQNRIHAHMPLQIDASVRYGVCGGRFTQCKALTRDDFSIDTPYNTYLYQGVPPTPIANPSPSSIQAALKPAKTSYFYYLFDPASQKSLFSETFDQHNESRSKYLGM